MFPMITRLASAVPVVAVLLAAAVPAAHAAPGCGSRLSDWQDRGGTSYTGTLDGATYAPYQRIQVQVTVANGVATTTADPAPDYLEQFDNQTIDFRTVNDRPVLQWAVSRVVARTEGVTLQNPMCGPSGTAVTSAFLHLNYTTELVGYTRDEDYYGEVTRAQ